MNTLRDILEAGLSAERSGGGHPLYPGAVALLLHHGEVTEHVAVGDAVRYGPAPAAPDSDSDSDGGGDGGHDGDPVFPVLPEAERIPMRPDTVFDVASLTKLFTAATALTVVDEGLFGLDDPVAPIIPEWSGDQRGRITLRHLLTHTAGTPSVRQLWHLPSPAQRVAAVLEVTPAWQPGDGFEYSCVDYIVVGLLLERLTGTRLARLVEDAVLTPLQLTDTTFRPGRRLVERCAATEYQQHTGRGMVRGEVHDESSWALGGAAGNAGLFSTAADLARFAEMLRRGGELDGVRVLEPDTAHAMVSDHLPGHVNPGYGHGLGPRIGDPSFMGVLADHGAYGHTGFTGTSLVVGAGTGTVTILLTNRVHPSREWSDISALRRRLAELTAVMARS